MAKTISMEVMSNEVLFLLGSVCIFDSNHTSWQIPYFMDMFSYLNTKTVVYRHPLYYIESYVNTFIPLHTCIFLYA